MGAPPRGRLASVQASPSRCDTLAAQRLSAETYNEILSTAEGSFAVLDLSGKTLYASPNTNIVLGVPPEALVGCAPCRSASHTLAAVLLTRTHALRRRLALEGVVHPESRNHLAAMIRAVRDAPPWGSPATATIRAGWAAGDQEPRWSHIEFKLSSDVRAHRARACLRGAAPRI